MTLSADHEPAPAGPVPVSVCEHALTVYGQKIAGVPANDQTTAHTTAVVAAASYAYTAGVTAARDRMLRALADAFARSGVLFADTPEVVDDVLADIGDKAEGSMRKFFDALATDLWDGLEFSNAAMCDLLAIVAGLRDGLGFTPTRTGKEIRTLMGKEDLVTGAADQLRLHLLSEHGDVNSLGAPDRLVHLIHDRRYANCTTAETWDENLGRLTVSEIPANCGRDAVADELAMVLARVDAAQVGK